MKTLQPTATHRPRSAGGRRALAAVPAAGVRAALAERSRRIVLLLALAAVLGLFDLALTIAYMRGAGMVELNPLARAMIDLGGAGQLIRFKLFTIATSCGILYLLRRHRQAEICAWISLTVLAALTAHWLNYNAHAHTMATLADAGAAASDPRWVYLE